MAHAGKKLLFYDKKCLQGVLVIAYRAAHSGGPAALAMEQLMPTHVSAALAASVAIALAAIMIVFFGTPASCAATKENVMTYSDPLGRFTVPVPINWTATTAQGQALIQSPDGAIKMTIEVDEGVERNEAVKRAWSLAEPGYNVDIAQVVQAPSRPGISETWIYNYEPAGEQFSQAVAEVQDNKVFVTLIRGNQMEIGRRQAQIAIILSGLSPTGVSVTDLSRATANSLSTADLSELSNYIEEAMHRFDVPGAAVAVVQNEQVILLEGYGVRRLGSDDPITPQTRMMIGSTGKTMTTMLLARLVDEGLFDWDTPVQQILPQFAVADAELSRRITVRNLVCACTGVPRRDMEFIFNADNLTAESVIDQLKSFEFFTGFGEAFQYSNQLVATSGWVAAAAAGSRFGDLDRGYFDLIEDRIFGPIGMASTTFDFQEVINSGNFALPHEFGPHGQRQPIAAEQEKVLLPVAPAGASWSTAEDMAKYLVTQLKLGVSAEGSEVVSSENLLTTREPQVQVSANMHYGLGWFIDAYKGQPVVQHGGNTLGFTSDLSFLPQSNLGIVVLSNARASNDFSLAVRNRLFEIAFDQPREYDAQARLAHAQLKSQFKELGELAVPDTELVEPFLGRFSNPKLGPVELKYDGSTLVLDIGEAEMELRLAKTNADGRLRLMATSGLLATTPVTLALEDGPLLVFGEGVNGYQFRPN
jgi:CubicO group peptidase (beta-lactamase class C family)